jgi:hypothetical protein
MGRLTVRQAAIVAVIATAGCSGFKMAGSGARTGAAGAAGGRAGTGGAAGSGGLGGGGAGGRGGTGGSTPIIIIDASVTDSNGQSNPDANCGARSKTATKVPPDILILLDRSGSMNECLGPDAGMGTNCGANSKWALLIPAITQVVAETDTEVNWGLKFFPDNSASTCNVGSTTAVDIGPANGAAVATAIMGATMANGGVVGYNGTPTRAAAAAATTYLSGLTDANKKFILLATDGVPTCGAGAGGMGSASADDSAAAVTAVGNAQTAGFPTFVVGIATGGGTADTTLSNMANAGGLPRTGSPTYYPVTSATDLADAIRTLIGVAASCTFQIGKPPTDDGTTSLDKIDVFGDGAPIVRDPTHKNGYDYTDASMMSIQVYGPLCDQIMSGTIRDVAVTFRCLII